MPPPAAFAEQRRGFHPGRFHFAGLARVLLWYPAKTSAGGEACLATWRIADHPVLGPVTDAPKVVIYLDGRAVEAVEGEPIAAALMAAGVSSFRTTPVRREPRGVFCAIGRCTDCVMTVDGAPNVRTCVTPVRAGMKIETQHGLGEWSDSVCSGSN